MRRYTKPIMEIIEVDADIVRTSLTESGEIDDKKENDKYGWV